MLILQRLKDILSMELETPNESALDS